VAVDSVGSNKYRVLLELGQGGTAHVYLAVASGPVGFNKLVVFKALKASLGSDPQFRRMFLNEARLSARLSHPNIVQVNEIIENEGLPVIVMEYLEGKPLSELRSRAGAHLTLAMHLRILSEALSGLQYSHELADYDGTPLNVVHRDMTPHNIFVTYDGQVKILDFGIAKLSGSLVETQTGVIKGKLRYMPAEQIIGDKVDQRTDVFAAGVMIWEAATHSRMWGNLSEAAIMNRVLNGEIPAPSSVRPDVAPELERICMKALQYDPNQRYATAAELQSDLDLYLSQLSDALTMREIGDFVTEHFEESRLQTLKIVEQQLNDVSLTADAKIHPASFAPASLSHTRGVYSSTISVTRTMQTPGSRLRRGAIAAAALFLVGGGVAVWRMQAGRDDPRSASASTADKTAAVPQGPAARTEVGCGPRHSR
jgi:serine/threonine-protein kinase